MGRPYRFYENRMLKKYFNTERLLDSQGRGSCDGKTEWLAIELAQHPIPKWIKEELQQAIDDNDGGKLLPIFVCREKYQPDDDAIVVMSLKDFNDHFGN